MVVHYDTIKVKFVNLKVNGLSRLQDEDCPFSAMYAADWLKSESKTGKISYGTLRENAQCNNTLNHSTSSVAIGCIQQLL